jgi:hypothetical protein
MSITQVILLLVAFFISNITFLIIGYNLKQTPIIEPVQEEHIHEKPKKRLKLVTKISEFMEELKADKKPEHEEERTPFCL